VRRFGAYALRSGRSASSLAASLAILDAAEQAHEICRSPPSNRLEGPISGDRHGARQQIQLTTSIPELCVYSLEAEPGQEDVRKVVSYQ